MENSSRNRLLVSLGLREPDWKIYRGLGNSRLVKSSYAWLILVPLAAKFLSLMPEQIEFHLMGADIPLSMGLPFRWKLFYFMALSFAVGQAVYAIRCPYLIKNYRDFKQYSESHIGSADLSQWFLILAINWEKVDATKAGFFSSFLQGVSGYPNADLANLARTFLGQDLQAVTQSTENDRSRLLDFFRKGAADNAFRNDVYDTFVNWQGSVRPVSRRICGFFMGIGIILFIALVADGLWTVLARM